MSASSRISLGSDLALPLTSSVDSGKFMNFVKLPFAGL